MVMRVPGSVVQRVDEGEDMRGVQGKEEGAIHQGGDAVPRKIGCGNSLI